MICSIYHVSHFLYRKNLSVVFLFQNKHKKGYGATRILRLTESILTIVVTFTVMMDEAW